MNIWKNVKTTELIFWKKCVANLVDEEKNVWPNKLTKKIYVANRIGHVKNVRPIELILWKNVSPIELAIWKNQLWF